MQDYLAEKYLSGAKGDILRERKRKKRKIDPTSNGGAMMLVDNEADSWSSIRNDEDKEDERAMVVESRTKAAFKPVNAANVRAKSPSPELEDDKPTIVNAPKFVGGLQSAAQLAEEAARRQKAEEKQRRKAKREAEERRQAALDAGLNPDEEEADQTVHRDASGRARDTKRERADAKRQSRADAEKEMAKMEWGKGLVQREDKEKRKRLEEEIAAKPVARYADDEDLNEQQKDVMRWNDPAAAFLSKPSRSSKTPLRPVYKGPPPPPNRFGIKPGYRWDGVDRGNGFEKQFLQRGNEVKMRDAAAYKWSADDM